MHEHFFPRYTYGHTFEPGQCRHAVQPARRFAPRVGHHPRDPARPAQAEPTARLPGNVPDEHAERRELGVEGEEQAIHHDERRQAEVDDEFDRPADPGAASSSDPAGSAEARRGPDTQPRVSAPGPTPEQVLQKDQIGPHMILAEQFEH